MNIEELAAREFDARIIVEAMGILTVKERKQQALDYAVARAKWWEAKRGLEEAITKKDTPLTATDRKEEKL